MEFAAYEAPLATAEDDAATASTDPQSYNSSGAETFRSLD
jgi:hypothetical protein